MTERTEYIVFTDIPENEGRLKKEMDSYELLEKLNIPFERVDHAPAASIDDCQNVDQLLGIEICKNLFLCNAQKTKFYLLMMPGTKQFKTKDLSKQINSSRLSFASPEFMEKLLNVTPGSVTILGLMYDTENKVQLLIDKDIAESEFVGCHPCINTSSVKIRTTDMLDRLLPYMKHEPAFVEL